METNTIEQIREVLSVLKTQAKNDIVAFDQEINELNESLDTYADDG